MFQPGKAMTSMFQLIRAEFASWPFIAPNADAEKEMVYWFRSPIWSIDNSTCPRAHNSWQLYSQLNPSAGKMSQKFEPTGKKIGVDFLRPGKMISQNVWWLGIWLCWYASTVMQPASMANMASPSGRLGLDDIQVIFKDVDTVDKQNPAFITTETVFFV